MVAIAQCLVNDRHGRSAVGVLRQCLLPLSGYGRLWAAVGSHGWLGKVHHPCKAPVIWRCRLLVQAPARSHSPLCCASCGACWGLLAL